MTTEDKAEHHRNAPLGTRKRLLKGIEELPIPVLTSSQPVFFLINTEQQLALKDRLSEAEHTSCDPPVCTLTEVPVVLCN